MLLFIYFKLLCTHCNTCILWALECPQPSFASRIIEFILYCISKIDTQYKSKTSSGEPGPPSGPYRSACRLRRRPHSCPLPAPPIDSLPTAPTRNFPARPGQVRARPGPLLPLPRAPTVSLTRTPPACSPLPPAPATCNHLPPRPLPRTAFVCAALRGLSQSLRETP